MPKGVSIVWFGTWGQVSYSGRGLRIAWGVALVMTLWIWSAVVDISWLLYNGMGIGYESGRYIMRQGRATAEISQTWGLLLYSMQYAGLFSLLATLALTAVLWWKFDLVMPKRILDRESTIDHILNRLIFLGAIGIVSVAVMPFVALVARSILR